MAEPTNETTAQIARLQFLRTHEHLISPWAFSKVERKSRDYELLAARFSISTVDQDFVGSARVEGRRA